MPSEKRTTTERALARVIDCALAELGLLQMYVDLSFVSDAHMRRLNREHRDKDYATDVLSFPSFEGRDGKLRVPAWEERCLGSIVIATGVARVQAKEQAHTFAAEVSRLLVHGVCHLAGYDHERGRAAEKKMFALEDRILEGLRYGPTFHRARGRAARDRADHAGDRRRQAARRRRARAHR